MNTNNFLKLKFPSLDFRQEPLFRWLIGISLTSYVGCVLLLVWSWQKLPPMVPLFYSLPWGESQLAATSVLVILTIALGLFYLVNILWTLLIPPSFVFFARLLVAGTTILLLLGITTIVQIVLLIT